MKDFILHLLEKYGGKISSWAWDKRWAKRDPNRWSKRNYVPWISKKTGKVHTVHKKTGAYKK